MLLGSGPAAAYTKGTALYGFYLLVADLIAGLQIFDIHSLSSPQLVSSCCTGTSMGVAVVASRAYVVANRSGLTVVDFADPTSPQTIGRCHNLRMPQRVIAEGRYAYVADADSGLRIVDVSNPAMPHIVGTCSSPDWAVGRAKSGRYV